MQILCKKYAKFPNTNAAHICRVSKHLLAGASDVGLSTLWFHHHLNGRANRRDLFQQKRGKRMRKTFLPIDDSDMTSGDLSFFIVGLVDNGSPIWAIHLCFVSITETITQTNSDSSQKSFLKLGIRNVMFSMVTQNINKF